MTDNMEKPPFLVKLDISNFRFAIGGEHYYGKYAVRSKAPLVRGADGNIRSRTIGGYGAPKMPDGDGRSVTRRMSAACAAYLNEKDDTDMWRAGESTGRFDDTDSLILAACAQFKDYFDVDRDILIMEDPDNDDAGAADIVLSAPMPYRETLQNTDYDGQREIFRRAGYTCTNPEFFDEL